MRVARDRRSANTVALIVASTATKQNFDEIPKETSQPAAPERNLERLLLFNVSPGVMTSIKAHTTKFGKVYGLSALLIFALIVAVMIVALTSNESDLGTTPVANGTKSTPPSESATWPWENGPDQHK
ncbi:MAG: uncharacterized protein KVP18_003061 [Porospora cf. gigantea A]|uniref:uncharacterized protein n=1 Tax=Porospora cf. gigantea A TaxID=2853593 RepID=UPI00355A47F6|nr:MAG: hypothetical protein KVP18_003061 [Porospora cf. gigantea A]